MPAPRAIAAQPRPKVSTLEPSKELDEFLATVAGEVVTEFADRGLKADGLALAAIDLTPAGPDPSFPVGSYRGSEIYYPASVVKTFYLAFYEAEKEAGRLKDTPELVRAVKDMITLSSNDATGFVVDSITGTTSGPELSGREWEQWKQKRNAVNRWLAARGYPGVNANQKTFCEDAYGREQAFRDGGKNRNQVTALEIARMFKEIVRGEVVGRAGTDEMLSLLSRDVSVEKPPDEAMEISDAWQVGQALPKGTRIWAKSGDAYDVHHLVGRIVLRNGGEFIAAVFTRGVKTVPGVIPRAYEKVAARFLAMKLETPR